MNWLRRLFRRKPKRTEVDLAMVEIDVRQSPLHALLQDYAKLPEAIRKRREDIDRMKFAIEVRKAGCDWDSAMLEYDLKYQAWLIDQKRLRQKLSCAEGK